MTLLLVSSTSLWAQLSVNYTNSTASNSCNGAITVSGDADAAPFSVTVTSAQNTYSKTQSGIQGTTKALFEGLCPGTYKVTAKNRFGCVHILEDVIISNDSGGGGNDNFGIAADVTTGDSGLKVIFSSQDRPSGSLVWKVSPSFGYSFDNSTTENSINPVIKFIAPGTYTVWLEITNNSNVVKSNEVTILINSSVPVEPTFTWAGNQVIGEDVVFTGLSNPCGSVDYDWTFIETDPATGFKTTTEKPNSFKVTHNFTYEGTHQVILKVTNTCGGDAEISRTISITKPDTPNYDLRATLYANEVIRVGYAASFLDTTYDVDGIIDTWEWFFNGSTTPEFVFNRDNYKQSVSKTFDAPGTYSVRLVVRDKYGRSSAASRNIIVKDGFIKLRPKYGLINDYKIDRLAADSDYLVTSNINEPGHYVFKKVNGTYTPGVTLKNSDNYATADVKMSKNHVVTVSRNNGSFVHYYIYAKSSLRSSQTKELQKISYYNLNNYHRWTKITLSDDYFAHTADNGYVYMYKRLQNGEFSRFPQKIKVIQSGDIRQIDMDDTTLVVSSSTNRVMIYERGNDGIWRFAKTLVKSTYIRSVAINQGNILINHQPQNGSPYYAQSFIKENGTWTSVGALFDYGNANGFSKMNMGDDLVVARSVTTAEGKFFGYKKNTSYWKGFSNIQTYELMMIPGLGNFSAAYYQAIAVGDEYIVQGTYYPGWPNRDNPEHFIYVFNTDTYCDRDFYFKDNQVINSGQRITEEKGIVGLGGTKYEVSNNAGLDITARDITLNKGFVAHKGSNVIINAKECDALDLSKNNTSFLRSNTTLKTEETILEEVETDHLVLYPNPVEDRLQIESNENIRALQIFDTSGRSIYNNVAIGSTSHSLEVTNYPPGIYHVRVTTDTKTVQKKIIIRNK